MMKVDLKVLALALEEGAHYQYRFKEKYGIYAGDIILMAAHNYFDNSKGYEFTVAPLDTEQGD